MNEKTIFTFDIFGILFNRERVSEERALLTGEIKRNLNPNKCPKMQFMSGAFECWIFLFAFGEWNSTQKWWKFMLFIPFIPKEREGIFVQGILTTLTSYRHFIPIFSSPHHLFNHGKKSAFSLKYHTFMIWLKWISLKRLFLKRLFRHTNRIYFN